MSGRLLLCVLLGLLLRAASCAQHDDPRGDVVLDVAVARSLAAGEGFASGYERGQPKLVGLDAPIGPQDRADQHPPLWPLLGAALSVFTGEAFLSLRLGSLLLSVLLLLLVGRLADRLTESIPGAPEGLPALAMALAACSFLLVDAAGNGSLYTAQALLVLLLVEALAAPRPAWFSGGVLLGALLLLNHQCLVLLPVPILVLLLGASRGERGPALLRGLGCTLAALVLLAPWWLRNALVFGDPLYSVNATYFLYRAGVEPLVSTEEGLVVFRFPQALGPLLFLRACLGFLQPNALYVLAAGLAVWPLLFGVVCAGSLPLFVRALRDRERRVLALVLCAAALAAVSILWPATKLRYLVPLAPLGILLGVRLLAARLLPGERAGVAAVLLAWLGALVFTAGDLAGAEGARPLRWAVLAGGGLLLLAFPLWLWHRRRPATRLSVIAASGLPVALLLALAVALGPGPGTAYHSAPFLPDFFGQDAESEEEEEVAALREGRRRALAAGARRLAGSVLLAAHREPALFELTGGLPEPLLRDVLAGLVRHGQADHVLLLPRDAPWLAERPDAVEGLVFLPPPDSDPRAALLFAVRR